MGAAVAPPLLRWSLVASCPRQAVYSATAAPARDRSDREDRILWRGRSIGTDYAEFLSHKFGAEAVRREVRVEWELGIGHCDIVLQPDPESPAIAIEVVSSAHAGDPMIQRKLLQLVGYMENLDVSSGCLVVLDPTDFSEDRFPVAKDTDRYRDLVAQKDERVAELLRWRETGELPGRVCRKQSEAIGHFCMHAAHCFEGVEPEPAPEVQSSDVLAAAQDFYSAKLQERAAKASLDAAEEERKAIQARLAELLEGAPAQIRSGPYAITRTDVARQPTFDWRKAELAGLFEPGLYGDFFTPGASYSTWKIEMTQIPGEVDYGDEAPF